MAIKGTIEQHGWAYPSRMLSTTGGAHVYDLQVEGAALDNGCIVAVDFEKYKGFHKFGYKDSTGVEAVVVDQSNEGDWLLVVTKPADGVLVRTDPMVHYEGIPSIGQRNFYNEIGDVAAGLELSAGDFFEASPKCFTDAEVKIGAKVTVENTTHKLVAAPEAA